MSEAALQGCDGSLVDILKRLHTVKRPNWLISPVMTSPLLELLKEIQRSSIQNPLLLGFVSVSVLPVDKYATKY